MAVTQDFAYREFILSRGRTPTAVSGPWARGGYGSSGSGGTQSLHHSTTPNAHLSPRSLPSSFTAAMGSAPSSANFGGPGISSVGQHHTERRHVVQLQYISWPDHGVPDSPDDLIAFVQRVRAARIGYDTAPVVVHCSAGIGRTGVLITMETAMACIEAGQPVRPLQMVTEMRDQRAMLIQTTTIFHAKPLICVKIYAEVIVVQSHQNTAAGFSCPDVV
ncbi:unnamed protein product [Protopolystoma xenopodis]|uniref:Tyrosine specific protein phosphatases domain-containing protein n=1 Tax=Protopolystoma xenopodis TaxID=117903 RepID=A0A448XDN1_9PLAT|nr:unnamed protein product [Protopolystoma xenopodis]